jgi:Fe-S oxidoreductase
MLQGDPIGKSGWRDEAVKDALDLCLACKGCKGDCPVNVDMASYKAEFLSHYYAHRLRPITAYSMGLVHWWARAAALIPNVANLVTHAPVVKDVAKAVAGIAPQRDIPYFAPKTFQQWFKKRSKEETSAVGRREVILWPDTFNNHFHPETAVAAVDVLESAGFRVRVPLREFCCGRPLFDWGMLDTAKSLLRSILTELSIPIRSGIPVIVLEPSCAAVFRDELPNLFPDDEDARRLKQQTYVLSEFLRREAKDFRLPKLACHALVQIHCHQEALMKTIDEEAVLKAMGVDFESLNSGCCGMAGAFGFEKGDHYDVSINCGERVLLPRVREATDDTLIVADGFSCREQIAQQTDRKAFHLAEVIDLALRTQSDFGRVRRIEDAAWRVLKSEEFKPASIERTAITLGAGVVLGGAVLWYLRNRGQATISEA